MSRACVYVPARGQDTFRKLKKDLGYKLAAVVFNKITGSDFLRIYGDKVSIDSEGVPTYESIIKLPIIKDFIGIRSRIEGAQKDFSPVDNTLNNASALIKKALEFNRSNTDMVAIVDYTEDGKILVKIEEATEETQQMALDQYRIQMLNEKMAEMLRPAGITFLLLNSRETALGRVGHTQFVRVQNTANEFTVLLEAANNFEGMHAISEEFAHYIIGILHLAPLVSRSIEFLKDENNAREVLGVQFDSVYRYYKGNMDLIAEEAAGHLFQKSLIKQADVKKTPLLRRMVDYILNLFKGISPRVYLDSMDSIVRLYDELAKQIISGDKTITKKDINKAKRVADFNALSERVNAQLETLNKLVVKEYKAAALMDNLEDRAKYDRTEKSKARLHAEDLSVALKESIEKEESMAAIATYLTSALLEILQLLGKINNLDNMTAKDRFTILRNALITIQKYKDTINELLSITRPSFLSDEEIAKQAFVVLDSSNVLADYEVSSEVETIDTIGKTVDEILDIIVNESKKLSLSDDESCYVNSETGQKSARVTSVIEADLEGHKFDPNSPWKTPATNIGTGIDELTRDFISGRILKMPTGDYFVEGRPIEAVYPNATRELLTHFLDELEAFKAQEKRRGITLVSRDITVDGTITTTDGTGKEHRISVAGTLDLLGYDSDGNWYIYDMKTHRSDEISEETMKKYRRQLTEYKHFLEQKYGIKIKEIRVLPIKVSYPTPEGFRDGTAKYEVSTEAKPEGYNGVHNNLLIINGDPFKKAYPKLGETIALEELNPNILYSKLANDPTNGLEGGVDLILGAIANMADLYGRFTEEFYEQALPQFVEFLKPIIGENIDVADPDNPGKFKTISVTLLVQKSDADVTLLQRWLSSMADNPDGLLLVFDKVVKIANDEKRIRTIEKAQEIIALGRRYEARGVTSYEWMFEESKMHYINKLYDETAYEKAKTQKDKELDALYGEFPEIGTEEYKKKKEAKEKWIKENNEYNTEFGKFLPKSSIYPSKFGSLSKALKEFYDEWMALKEELDAIIGPKTYLTNSIKIRKSNIERLHSITDGSAIESFVEGIKSKVLRSFDDDYARKEKKSIKNFDGSEFMKLPLYYLYADKKDAKDISTDVIGTLIAYADMVYGYDAMDLIVNPLEIGKELVKHRKIAARRNGLPLVESFKTKSDTHTEPIYVNTEESKFMELLNDFFESKVYQRYLKDYDDLPGGIDRNKAASALLKLGSTVQLGFNLMAQTASVLTGIAMQNIEAAAGEFFKARELAAADKEFGIAMGDFVGDIGRRAKESKLALFDELFDVRQNFSGNIKHKDFLNKNLLTRIFGPGILYIGLDAGDHWLYNRTAIAIALRYKLIDTTNGNKEISLWDALVTKPVDPNNPKAGNKLVIKDGVKKADGSTFSARDISELSGRMRYVNLHLFGIYNQEDAIAARRVITGRFLMQYRDWIPAQLRYRFGSATTNLEKGKDAKVEGYYITMYRFSKLIYKELKNSNKTIPLIWNSLEDYEKANIRRAVAEVVQFAIIALVCRLLGKSKDKDRPWVLKMLRYALLRERTELGALVPGFSMITEGYKILKSPMAATNVMENTAGLIELIWVPNYFDEIETGDYKGHSTAYKAFFKSPLSLWYKTFKRIEDPDKASTYFK